MLVYDSVKEGKWQIVRPLAKPQHAKIGLDIMVRSYFLRPPKHANHEVEGRG